MISSFKLYKLEILRQVNRILRTKFMPGVGRMNMDMSLYDINPSELTTEQKLLIKNVSEIKLFVMN